MIDAAVGLSSAPNQWLTISSWAHIHQVEDVKERMYLFQYTGGRGGREQRLTAWSLELNHLSSNPTFDTY